MSEVPGVLPTTQPGRRAIVVFALALAASLPLNLLAHELGTTRVSILALDHSRFDIQVVTDASALLEKMETVAGETPTGITDPPALQRKLESMDAIFQRRLALSFDGAGVQPALEWSVAPPSAPGGGPVATLRLTGAVPESARALGWKYSWTFTAYALIDARDPYRPTTEWLEGDRSSSPVSLEHALPYASRIRLAAQYVVLGFTHILPKGLDHVLFVLGIFLLSRRAKPILLQVTAFTIAHSITLALSIFEIVSLPPSIVEPAIAFSIAYIAIENVVTRDLRPWRYALVFGFGLLHGLGFAGVLREVGLPRSELVTALFGFNVGVELGQLTVIGAAFLLVGVWFRDRAWYHQRVVLPASVLIACLGLYWTFERLPFG